GRRPRAPALDAGSARARRRARARPGARHPRRSAIRARRRPGRPRGSRAERRTPHGTDSPARRGARRRPRPRSGGERGPRRYTDLLMSYNAWFQCINGCPGQFDLREVIYRCPTCGDLLEVQHDMDALRSRSAAAWMQLFKDRTNGNVYPYGSGVWSKKEWVVPFIDNENIVSMYEGNSNLR